MQSQPLSTRLPFITTMPKAVGTGIIIQSGEPFDEELKRSLCETVSDFESAFSRFSATSKVGMIARGDFGGIGGSSCDIAGSVGGSDGISGDAMATAEHGETREIAFPDYAAALFDIYDTFHAVTGGAFDPCVASDLVKLGYGPDLAIGAHANSTGAIPMGSPGSASATGPTGSMGSTGFTNPSGFRDSATAAPCWGRDVTHEGPVLILRGTASNGVSLDFGAAGKGFLVDLLSRQIAGRMPGCDFVIDAGGDMYTTVDITVAMESPWDDTEAVGVVQLPAGSALCASSPSRRHWTVADSLQQVHHLLDALTGEPVRTVAASWCMVPAGSSDWPTGWCDAQSTAAFLGLMHGFPFARIMSDGSTQVSPRFPARLHYQN